jgi:hypothetical protein
MVVFSYLNIARLASADQDDEELSTPTNTLTVRRGLCSLVKGSEIRL